MELDEDEATRKRKREFCDDPSEEQPDSKIRKIGPPFTPFSIPDYRQRRILYQVLADMEKETKRDIRNDPPGPLIEAVAASTEVEMTENDEEPDPPAPTADGAECLGITRDDGGPNTQNLAGTSDSTQGVWNDRLRASTSARRSRRSENLVSRAAAEISTAIETTNDENEDVAMNSASILTTASTTNEGAEVGQVSAKSGDENGSKKPTSFSDPPPPVTDNPSTNPDDEPPSQVAVTQNISAATASLSLDEDRNKNEVNRPSIDADIDDPPRPQPTPEPMPDPTQVQPQLPIPSAPNQVQTQPTNSVPPNQPQLVPESRDSDPDSMRDESQDQIPDQVLRELFSASQQFPTIAAN